jgi:hypothetical protein
MFLRPLFKRSLETSFSALFMPRRSSAQAPTPTCYSRGVSPFAEAAAGSESGGIAAYEPVFEV